MKTHYHQANEFKYFEKWEELSEDERIYQKNKNLNEYINFLNEVPFYNDRLKKINLNSNHPLKDVIPLTGDQLKQNLPPFGSELLPQKSNSYNIYQSGGTSGFPKTSIFNSFEMDLLQKTYARGFYACGLNDKDIVGNVFATGSLYMTFNHSHDTMQRFGCTNLGLGHTVDPSFFKLMCEKFNINTLVGVGSTIVNLLNTIDENYLQNYQFEKLFYGGEHIYDTDKKKLMNKYNFSTILSPGYGTVETWYIGHQCTHSNSGVFHAFDDQCYIEIINQDTGDLCGSNEVGIIHVTPFLRKANPILRYLVGDKAYWTGEECSCGRTTPTFKLLGRGTDNIRIGFDTIEYESILQIYSKITSIGAIQIERKRIESKDQFIIRLETSSELDKTQLLKILLTERSVLKNDIDKKTVHLPIIEVYSIGEIPLNPRTGKLTKVIDFHE